MSFNLNDLTEATVANNLDMVVEIHLAGMFNVLTDSNGITLLQKACANQAELVVDYILSQPGIYVDAIDHNGKSAIDYAIEGKSNSIIRKLVAVGSKLNQNHFLKCYNFTDLDISDFAINDHTEIICHFIENNIKNDQLIFKIAELAGNNLNFDKIYRKMFAFVSGCGCGECRPSSYGSTYYFDFFYELERKLKKDQVAFWAFDEFPNHPDGSKILKSIYENSENIPEGMFRLEYFLKNDDFEMILKFKDKFHLEEEYQKGKLLHDWLDKLNKSKLDLDELDYRIDILIYQLGLPWFHAYQEKICQEDLDHANYLKKTIYDKIYSIVSENMVEKDIIGLADDILQFYSQHFIPITIESIEEQLFSGPPSSNRERLAEEILSLGKEYIIPNKSILYPSSPSMQSDLMWFKNFLSDGRLDIMEHLFNRFPSSLSLFKNTSFRKNNLFYSISLHYKYFHRYFAKNKYEIVSMDPVEEIPLEFFILLSNGIAWDMRNLVDYIIKTRKGINEYDDYFPIEEFRGKPIWDNDDNERFKILRDVIRNSKVAELFQSLYDYMKYQEHILKFSDQEKEEFRRFASIFWARGGWWNREIAKFCSKYQLEEWDDIKGGIKNYYMPSGGSDKLAHHLAGLKAKYLDLFREFFSKKLEKQQRDALLILCGQELWYFEDVVRGRSCIMEFGNILNIIIKKFGLDIEKLNADLIGDAPSSDLDKSFSDLPRDLNYYNE